MRGDNSSSKCVTRSCVGTPPHAWGQFQCRFSRFYIIRYTPTCVGTILLFSSKMGSSGNLVDLDRFKYAPSLKSNFLILFFLSSYNPSILISMHVEGLVYLSSYTFQVVQYVYTSIDELEIKLRLYGKIDMANTSHEEDAIT